MSEQAKIEKALGLASGALAQAGELAALSTALVQPNGPGAIMAQIEHQLSLTPGSLAQASAEAALSTALVQPNGPGAIKAQIEHQLSLAPGSLAQASAVAALARPVEAAATVGHLVGQPALFQTGWFATRRSNSVCCQ